MAHKHEERAQNFEPHIHYVVEQEATIQDVRPPKELS
jgi:hypothetical protein